MQSVLANKNNLEEIIGPDGETTKWEFVNPRMAKQYLETTKDVNRRFMPSLSGRYAEDMKEFNWVTTHEGIAFNKANELIDGQHRLGAIIESGVGQWMLVTRNLDQKAIQVINIGKIRSLAHALQILGYEHSGNRFVAVARAMIFGPIYSSKMPTNQQIKNFIDRHLEAIIFASTVCSKKVGTASVAGVIARAFYHCSQESLTRFCMAMVDEIPPDESRPEDTTARAVKKSTDVYTLGGNKQRITTYRKVQSGLRYYLEGKVVKKIYGVEEDLFPLPVE